MIKKLIFLSIYRSNINIWLYFFIKATKHNFTTHANNKHWRCDEFSN